MSNTPAGLNSYVKNKPTGKITKTPPQRTGLNTYVKTITPEVSRDGFKAAERGMFVCSKGHTFHETFTKVKKSGAKSCPKCNSIIFKLDALVKTKQFIFGVQHHLKMPDMATPLRFLVATQNRRNAAAELAKTIEKTPLSKLENISYNLFDSDNNDSKYMAMLDMVDKALNAIVALNEDGNTKAANVTKDELVSVLNGN